MAQPSAQVLPPAGSGDEEPSQALPPPTVAFRGITLGMPRAEAVDAASRALGAEGPTRRECRPTGPWLRCEVAAARRSAALYFRDGVLVEAELVGLIGAMDELAAELDPAAAGDEPITGRDASDHRMWVTADGMSRYVLLRGDEMATVGMGADGRTRARLASSSARALPDAGLYLALPPAARTAGRFAPHRAAGEAMSALELPPPGSDPAEAARRIEERRATFCARAAEFGETWSDEAYLICEGLHRPLEGSAD